VCTKTVGAIIFPPSFAEDLPRFWVPLGGKLTKVSSSSLDFVFGGTSPKPPGMGHSPLHPHVFAHPRLLMVHQGFESHPVAGLQGLAIGP